MPFHLRLIRQVNLNRNVRFVSNIIEVDKKSVFLLVHMNTIRRVLLNGWLKIVHVQCVEKTYIINHNLLRFWFESPFFIFYINVLFVFSFFVCRCCCCCCKYEFFPKKDKNPFAFSNYSDRKMTDKNEIQAEIERFRAKRRRIVRHWMLFSMNSKRKTKYFRNHRNPKMNSN